MFRKMRRGLALALAGTMLCTVLSACSSANKEDPGAGNTLQVQPEMYQASYWSSMSKNSGNVLLSATEISQLNTQTAAAVDGCVDLVTYPSELSASTLNAYLAEFTLPETDLYSADGTLLYEAPEVTYDEDGNEVAPEGGTEYLDAIRANMNLDAVSATNRVSYALTLQNTSLRRFPSSDRAFASAEDANEDLFLQSPLVIGEPVVVLHTSADQTWYYVQLRNCRGWVYWSDLVFLEKSAWVSYIESTDFIVVTDASISITPPNPTDARLTLYMGTVLPIYKDAPGEINGQSTQGCYVVRIPAKDRFGNLEYSPVLIPMSNGVSCGFLPYTYENVLKQAFKLAGEKLHTRGLSYGWDADRFFTTIYKTFGIYLPFTIAEQKSMTCNDANLTDMSARERDTYFSKLSPGTLLYSASSAFLYLGKVDGVSYILHPAASFFVGETRYTANSILITRMDIIQESGLSYYDAATLGRVFAVVK